MKKLSLAKIIAALVIVNCYMFTCGVMGTVGDAQMLTEDTSEEHSETAAPAGDIAQAEGQGTLDFLVPDETGTGVVQINLLNMAPMSLSDKMVMSTYSALSDELPQPQEATDEILGEDDSTLEPTSETYDSEEILGPREETEEIPAVTTPPATTSTTVATTQATAATTTTTTATTESTSAAASTTTTAKDIGGIPVDADDVPPVSSANDDQPDEIDPDSSSSDAAAGEILTVKANGSTVSGSALEIVGRMTQNEVGHTFAPEAIKAQAVAAYTYVKFCNEYGTYPSVGLASTVSDSVNVLVQSVLGKAIYYNGALIQAVYSASSAGYTASSKNVWGTDYPYLQSRFCDLDKQYDPNYGRKVEYTSAEIKSKVLEKTGIDLTGDPSGWLSVETNVDGFYVGQMNVGGYHSYTDSSGDSVKITGRVFRERIMSFELRSSAFDVEYDANSDKFIFTTYGYGHGVGMSQNGANALATYLGYDYKEILTYYYQGTEVK